MFYRANTNFPSSLTITGRVKYAPATEIWAYVKNVALDRGLTKFIRFDEEIVTAQFTDGCWRIETAGGITDFADVDPPDQYSARVADRQVG